MNAANTARLSRRRLLKIAAAAAASGALAACRAGGVTVELAEIPRPDAARLRAAAAIAPAFSFVYDGKPSADVLSVWQVERSEKPLNDARTERTVSYSDPATGLRVRCVTIEYADYPAVDWVLYLENTGAADTPIIENILPLDVRLAAAEDLVTLHYSLGESNSEYSFAPMTEALGPGAQFRMAPNGGRSSDGFMPFFNLATGDHGVAVAIGWSGQWAARFTHPADEPLRVQAGIETTHFTLHPGESVRTPRVLAVSWQGDDPITGNNLLRRVLLAHYVPRRNGEFVFSPICGSVNWADLDGTYEQPHLSVMPALAERGIEVFWSDMDPQHWYPEGFPNGTGNWMVDPAKYPHGLEPIGQGAHAVGLEYLLWFEPERVAVGTQVATEHPEFVHGGEMGGLYRLDDPAAWQWLLDMLDERVTAWQVDWMRWDFNIEPLGYWQRNDPPDRKGITETRHIEGLYALWDELRNRHPGLVIDVCASGGRRIDLETLSRGLPLWHSDMQCFGPKPFAEQLQNGGLFRWTPNHGCGNFDYEPSYGFRSGMTAGNILCYGNYLGRLSTADPDKEDEVKRTVAIYRKMRPFMLGDFYPLFPHSYDQDVWYGYQFHRPDLDAGFAVVFRREACPEAMTAVAFRALDPAGSYEVTMHDTGQTSTLTGQELAVFRAEIEYSPGSLIVFYRKSA
jgi:alpha-galactosidase